MDCFLSREGSELKTRSGSLQHQMEKGQRKPATPGGLGALLTSEFKALRIPLGLLEHRVPFGYTQLPCRGLSLRSLGPLDGCPFCFLLRHKKL